MSKKANRKKLSKSTWNNIRKDIACYRWSILALMAVIIISRMCLAFAPHVSAGITDTLVLMVKDGNINIHTILGTCILLAVLYLVGQGVNGFINMTMIRLSQDYSKRLRNRAQKKLNRLPLGYLDTHPSGNILSYMTNDIKLFGDTFESIFPTLLGQTVLLFCLVVIMLVTNAWLALIYAATLSLSLFATSKITSWTKKMFKEQQVILGKQSSLAADVYANHAILKSYCCEKDKFDEFERMNREYEKVSTKARFISGFLSPITTICMNTAYIALCVIGGGMIIQGRLTLGEFQAFLLYGNMINTPLTTLASCLNQMQSGYAAIERIYDFLAVEEVLPEQPTENLAVTEDAGSIEFRNVRFGYLPEKILIQDASFTAKPGTTMAIVGPTGAGKTTLVNLLMRFYEINGGNIYLDGVDTAKLSRDNLRSHFGMVLQDTWLFDGTIAENIGYGNPSASREEIIAAAKSVQCNTFIDKLPEGYDTHISEESAALSQGEKQLLAIARVVLANPRILILDEATSQVDARTEYLITTAMEKMMENRTCFIIAHRLFTIRNADSIIYMDNGDIKEIGSHSELMKLNGRYASMYRSASQ